MSTHEASSFPPPTPCTFPILLQLSIKRMEEDVRKRQDTIEHKLDRINSRSQVLQNMSQPSGIKQSPNTESTRQSTILKYQKEIEERKVEMDRMNVRRDEQIQILDVLKYTRANLHVPSVPSLLLSQATTSMQVRDQDIHTAATDVVEKENRDPQLRTSVSASNRIEAGSAARMSNSQFGLASSETSRGDARSASPDSVTLARSDHTGGVSRVQLGSQDEGYRRHEVSRNQDIQRGAVKKTQLGRQHGKNNEVSRNQGVEVTENRQDPEKKQGIS